MVVCFETSDPARFEQLKHFLIERRPDEYKGHEVYAYDPWNGLGTLNETGQITREAGGGRFASELQGQAGVPELARALRIMDEKLRKQGCIFILHGLTLEHPDRQHLCSALRTWANSPDLIAKSSLVILFGLAIWSILNEETRDLVAVVEVPMASELELVQLVDFLGFRLGVELKEEEGAVLKSALKGLNLHQSEAVLRESYALRRSFDLEQVKTLKGEAVKKTGMLEVEEPRHGFDAIGGYEPLKHFISRKIIDVILNPGKASRFGLRLPRGILFFGPPGGGKSLFATALAKEVKLPFMRLRTENIYSQFLGESGTRMRTAIRTAEEMSPAVVFIDEIDRFGKRVAPMDSAGEESRRVFSQLLEWLGEPDRKAIIVGTTNRPDDLDDAFIRTGRFDYKIPVSYPDPKARLEILRVHLGLPDSQGRMPPVRSPPLLAPKEQFLSFLDRDIVSKTEGYTGAELEELVTRAKRNAFERGGEALDIEDFRRSLSSFCIDWEERKRQIEDYRAFSRKYADEATLCA